MWRPFHRQKQSVNVPPMSTEIRFMIVSPFPAQ
jgi:hypothetical protein